MEVTYPEECSICGRVWTLNPVTAEMTCFIHGRPDGSEMERVIWRSHRED